MNSIPERRLLLLLAGVQFVNILDFVIMMPLGPHFIADLKVSPGQLGLLVSSYTIAAAISGLLLGRWINQQPRKTALLFAFSVFGIATLFCGLAHEYETFLLARIIAGAAGGPATAIVLTIVADAIPVERRGRAMSFVQSAFSVASVVGVPGGLYLANLGSWRSPFLVLAGLAIVLFISIWKWLPHFDAHLHVTRPETSLRGSLREVFADANSRRAYLTHTFVMIGGFSMIPFLSPYLVNNRAVGKDDLGLFYLTGGILTFIAMQFIGRWTDKYGSLRVYSLAAFFFAINMQFVLWAPLSGLEVLPLFALYMVFNASRMVPLMTLYSKIPPAAIRGAFMSYLSTVQHLASGAGILLAGVFLTLDEAGQLRNFAPVAEATVVVTLTAVLLARKLQSVADEKARALSGA